MLTFIYICILVLNIVAVLLTYYFLGKEMDKKSKGIFIIVGVAIIYLLVSFIYWVSTKSTNLEIDDDTCKNLITLTFVPVNAIIIMPFLASSYKKLKNGKLKQVPFRNRCILLAVVMFIILLIEFFYFKDIQNGILSILQSK